MNERNQAMKASAMRILRIVSKVAICLILLIPVALYIGGWYQLNNKDFFNSMALRPMIGAAPINDEEPPGIKKETFYIDSTEPGAKMHCWLYRVPKSDKLVIVNHGNAGNISHRVHIARALTKAGASTLLYDYRGYGMSGGKELTLNGILQDGLTAYDYARNQLHYAPEHILLYGESIGAGVTCYVANNRQCGGVILQSGVGSVPGVARRLIAILNLYPDFAFPEPHFDNVAAVQTIRVPILIISGKLDQIVPYQHSEQMFATANQPKELVLLPDCGHNDMGFKDASEFQSAIDRLVAQVK